MLFNIKLTLFFNKILLLLNLEDNKLFVILLDSTQYIKMYVYELFY